MTDDPIPPLKKLNLSESKTKTSYLKSMQIAANWGCPSRWFSHKLGVVWFWFGPIDLRLLTCKHTYIHTYIYVQTFIFETRHALTCINDRSWVWFLNPQHLPCLDIYRNIVHVLWDTWKFHIHVTYIESTG